MNYLVRNVFLLAGLGLSVNSATAFEVEHEAHEHGHATLSVVQEKDELQLVFKSPSMNIVGFEHQPSSKEQHAKVDKAKESLGHADELFVINKEAKCSVEHVKIASALLEEPEHGHHDEHDEHHADHKDDHHDDHEKHDDHHDNHKEDHHDEHGHDETHSEFEAEYHFECENIDSLKEIKVTLFESFNTLEEIEAQVITGKGQRLVELDHDNVKIEL